MRRIVTDRVEEFGTITSATVSQVIDCSRAEGFSVNGVVDVNTPAAKATPADDVDADEDTFTEAAHGFYTGLKGQFTTSDTLPDGLATSTDYFVIVVDADTYQVASSLANALAGTPVDLIDVGVGDHTFTPTSIAGGSATLRKSNVSADAILKPDYEYDAADWTDVAAATSVTADGNVWFEVSEPMYRAAVIVWTLTAGSMDVTQRTIVKESK